MTTESDKPAFPIKVQQGDMCFYHEGISKHEYAKIQLLSALISKNGLPITNDGTDYYFARINELAYKILD